MINYGEPSQPKPEMELGFICLPSNRTDPNLFSF